MSKPIAYAAVVAVALICAEVYGQAGAPKDGELPLPDYKSWDSFLTGVQKTETKQIRDIYINETAAGADAAPLPDGSELVMEIYTAKVDADGKAVLADGKMVKDGLSKVFVMAKNAGWGEGLVPANGSWVYAAYEPDGSLAEVDYATCRACHLPMTELDFVPRLDEYLASR